MKELVSDVHKLKKDIEDNRRRIIEIDEVYLTAKEKLILALEEEKKEVGRSIRQTSEIKFGSVECKTKAVIEGLESQLEHCREMEQQLKEDFGQLFNQLKNNERNKERKLTELKKEMDDGFADKGQAILFNIEQHYRDTIYKLERDSEEVKSRKQWLEKCISDIEDQKKQSFSFLYCGFKR